MIDKSALRAGLAALALLVGTLSAHAETVLLTRGDNDFGLGWLFLDATGKCSIATPRHVIEATSGALVAPDLVDSFGRQHATANPRAAADDLDLAFLDVLGQLPIEGCTMSRLSGSSIQTLVDRMETANLAVATLYERQSIPVQKRASSQDEKGGAIIAFSPSSSEMGFQRGMSGGAILLSGRPIGMLLEVDTESGIGIALRFDVIAENYQRLAAAAPATAVPSATGGLDSITIAAGRVATADAGLGQYLSGQGALQLTPNSDRIVLLVDLPHRQVVSGVRLEGSFPPGASVIIESADQTTGFLFASRCELGAATECIFSPRRLSRIKLTIPASEGALVSLEALSSL